MKSSLMTGMHYLLLSTELRFDLYIFVSKELLVAEFVLDLIEIRMSPEAILNAIL